MANHRSVRGFFLFLGVLALPPGSALAQGSVNIDPQEILNKALREYGPVEKERIVTKIVDGRDCASNPRGGEHCWPTKVKVQVLEPYTDVLHATSAEIVSIDEIKFGKPVFTFALPDVYVKTVHGKNCTKTEQPINTTLQLAWHSTQTVRWSRTVTDSASHTIGLSFNQSFTANGATSGQTESGSVTFRHDVAVMDGKDQSWGSDSSASEQVVRKVAAGTEGWGTLKVVEGQMRVPFTALVLLDGSVDANTENITKASQAIRYDNNFNDSESQGASVSNRKVTISGTIISTASSDDSISFFERNLTDAECSGPNNDSYRIVVADK